MIKYSTYETNFNAFKVHEKRYNDAGNHVERSYFFEKDDECKYDNILFMVTNYDDRDITKNELYTEVELHDRRDSCGWSSNYHKIFSFRIQHCEDGVFFIILSNRKDEYFLEISFRCSHEDYEDIFFHNSEDEFRCYDNDGKIFEDVVNTNYMRAFIKHYKKYGVVREFVSRAEDVDIDIMDRYILEMEELLNIK